LSHCSSTALAIEYIKTNGRTRSRRKAGESPGCTSQNRGLAPVQLAWREITYVTNGRNFHFLTCIEYTQVPPPLRPSLHSSASATMSCLRMRRTQLASQVSSSRSSKRTAARTTFHISGLLRTEACATSWGATTDCCGTDMRLICFACTPELCGNIRRMTLTNR
jgi:hypothetical protein